MAPTTLLGPLLVTVIVYVVAVPGDTLATLSVFVIARSAMNANVSVSVALLFAGVGSVTPAGAVTVAVFTSVPVAAALTLPTTV